MSELGPQYADTLGALLFFVVLHSLVEKIEKRVLGLDIHVRYLGDGNIIGNIDMVVRALGIIEVFGARVRTNLNHRKSKFWWPIPIGNMEIFPSDIIRVTNLGPELLGSPIGTPEFMHEFVEQRIDKISVVDLEVEFMEEAHVDLSLLRGRLGFGKVSHLLRTCCPSDILKALGAFDDRLRVRVASILRTPFLNVEAWRHVALPIRLGGPGMTRTIPLPDPIFINSCITRMTWLQPSYDETQFSTCPLTCQTLSHLTVSSPTL